MSPHATVRACALPLEAALEVHAAGGAYTDCYAIVLPRVVTQAEYVEAFYTTAVFKIERWILAIVLSRPSTDAQARELAQGSLDTFAAWTVEHRGADQLVLAAGRTRSWLMTSTSKDPGLPGTQLYFGSAIASRRSGAGMGWRFRALLGFHKLYSRVLLGAASRRLRNH